MENKKYINKYGKFNYQRLSLNYYCLRSAMLFGDYHKQSQSGFDQAANIPLNDDDVVLSDNDDKKTKNS